MKKDDDFCRGGLRPPIFRGAGKQCVPPRAAPANQRHYILCSSLAESAGGEFRESRVSLVTAGLARRPVSNRIVVASLAGLLGVGFPMEGFPVHFCFARVTDALLRRLAAQHANLATSGFLLFHFAPSQQRYPSRLMPPGKSTLSGSLGFSALAEDGSMDSAKVLYPIMSRPKEGELCLGPSVLFRDVSKILPTANDTTFDAS